MKYKIVFIIFLLGLISSLANAQSEFRAVIRDSASNEPLLGATITEEGTTNGASSDEAGRVKVSVTGTGAVAFIVQYISYRTQRIIVDIPQQDSVMQIVMAPDGTVLGEVTVTSVRTNSRIEDVPTRVEVLGLDDLNEENGVKPGNIMSLLGDIAGIQLQQVSASSGNTFARIQGLNGRYTQLLKDGMPLFSGLSGSFGILQIPPLDLKQIEIIKGSVSTLYGGDAIGGIINLVSKDPTPEMELAVTANRSTLSETNINAYSARRFNKFGFTLFAGQTFQKQSDVDKDGLSDAPEVGSTVIHPKIVFYFNPKSTVTLNYTGTFDKRKGGDMSWFTIHTDTLYHVNNSIQRHSSDAKWFYELSQTSNLTLKFSNSYLTQRLGTKAYDFNATQLIYFSEASYFYKIKNMEWVGGLNFNGDQFDNSSTQLTEIKNYNYSTAGAFIQNTLLLAEKLTIESGFRGDYHNKYGFFALPRLSFMYKFSNPFTARINGGFGYKIPNLITYVNPETDLAIIAPNTTLKPELSDGINADVNFHKLLFNKLNITVNQAFFITNIRQPVDDSSVWQSVIALANGAEALQTKGLQTYARIKYRSFEFYASYVFTDVKKLYDASHPVLVVTPRHNFSTTFFYEPNEMWRGGIESSFIAGQLNQDYMPVKDYLLFAAMLQCNIGKTSFVLNGENLLDFRQNKGSKIYDGTIANPVFHKLWAPIDGRVINLSVKWQL